MLKNFNSPTTQLLVTFPFLFSGFLTSRVLLCSYKYTSLCELELTSSFQVQVFMDIVPLSSIQLVSAFLRKNFSFGDDSMIFNCFQDVNYNWETSRKWKNETAKSSHFRPSGNVVRVCVILNRIGMLTSYMLSLVTYRTVRCIHQKRSRFPQFNQLSTAGSSV